MIVKKSKKIGRWKIQFMIKEWQSVGLGIEYQHDCSTVGIKIGPFLFTIERI